MYDDVYDDTLNETDMLAICQGMDTTVLETTALGQEIATLSNHLWRQDLIEVDRQLKKLATTERLLNSQHLMLPDGYGSDIMVLAPDALLDTLTTLYTVLMAMFHETDIGQHYRPSPYAQRFLWAFASCAYLREAGFHQPPTMNRQVAEQTVMELNQRLTVWYQCLKQQDFTYECSRNRRNSRNNYQRLRQLMDALFARYGRLTVLRVDLSYSKMDGSYIDYETARYHREQMCEAFHRHELFAHLLGYAWKLEWKPKKGFHYHFLFFSMATMYKKTFPMRNASVSYGRALSPADKGITTTAIGMQRTPITTMPWGASNITTLRSNAGWITSPAT